MKRTKNLTVILTTSQVGAIIKPCVLVRITKTIKEKSPSPPHRPEGNIYLDEQAFRFNEREGHAQGTGDGCYPVLSICAVSPLRGVTVGPGEIWAV